MLATVRLCCCGGTALTALCPLSAAAAELRHSPSKSTSISPGAAQQQQPPRQPPQPAIPPAPPPVYSTPEFLVPSITVTRPDHSRIALRRSSNPFENLPEPVGMDRRIDGKEYDDSPRMDDTDWIEAMEKRSEVMSKDEPPDYPPVREHAERPQQQQHAPYRGAGEAYASPFKMDWHNGATLTELHNARSAAGKSRLEQWRESKMRSAQATPRVPEDVLYRYYQTPRPINLSATPWEPPRSEVQLHNDELLEELR